MKFKNVNDKFFTFEGVEGSGKSTIVKLIAQKLEKEGISIFLTREPGGTKLEFAEEIRNVIFKYKDINPITELFLFEASRSEHVEKIIKPNLEKGKIVLCDRFTDSTLVYQSLLMEKYFQKTESFKEDKNSLFQKKEDIKKTILVLNDIATNNLHPIITFIFDIDPSIALKRIENNRQDKNKFDDKKISFHNLIRNGYLELSKKNIENINNQDTNYILVNANQDTEKIVEYIYNKIKENI